MYKVVSLFAGYGGCDQGITGDFVFNQMCIRDRCSTVLCAGTLCGDP